MRSTRQEPSPVGMAVGGVAPITEGGAQNATSAAETTAEPAPAADLEAGTAIAPAVETAAPFTPSVPAAAPAPGAPPPVVCNYYRRKCL